MINGIIMITILIGNFKVSIFRFYFSLNRLHNCMKALVSEMDDIF